MLVALLAARAFRLPAWLPQQLVLQARALLLEEVLPVQARALLLEEVLLTGQ